MLLQWRKLSCTGILESLQVTKLIDHHHEIDDKVPDGDVYSYQDVLYAIGYPQGWCGFNRTPLATLDHHDSLSPPVIVQSGQFGLYRQDRLKWFRKRMPGVIKTPAYTGSDQLDIKRTAEERTPFLFHF
jgi:hypothetical protein